VLLVDAALGFINHLMADESWAYERLKAFAGQTARLELGALAFPLEITAGGLFKASDGVAAPAVTISLPADAPWRALQDRASLLAAAQVKGSAELAECLGFVFRNLRWDVESDLAQLLGDIAAHRLVQGGKQLFTWQQQQAENLALNLAEYFTEEYSVITRRQDLGAFCAEVGSLQEDFCNLEQRLAFLEDSRSA